MKWLKLMILSLLSLCGCSSDAEWHAITTAPKDGTVIEVRCVIRDKEQWRDLYQWTTIDMRAQMLAIANSLGVTNGELYGERYNSDWRKVGDPSSGFVDGFGCLSWREPKGLTG